MCVRMLVKERERVCVCVCMRKHVWVFVLMRENVCLLKHEIIQTLDSLGELESA